MPIPLYSFEAIVFDKALNIVIVFCPYFSVGFQVYLEKDMLRLYLIYIDDNDNCQNNYCSSDVDDNDSHLFGMKNDLFNRSTHLSEPCLLCRHIRHSSL